MRRRQLSERALPWLLATVVGATPSAAAATGDGDGPPAVSMPGAPAAAEDPPVATAGAVTVTTDRELYQPGERVLVTVSNGLSVPLYAPPRGGCSLVGVWRLQDAQWLRVGACPTLNVGVTAIPAMSDLTRVLGPAVQAPGAPGPVVIGPVTPSVSLDVATLPTAVPWKPGDPVQERPEGAIAAPFSVTDGNLVPGTYRIEFGFGAGPASERVQTVYTVYSEPFVVKD